MDIREPLGWWEESVDLCGSLGRAMTAVNRAPAVILGGSILAFGANALAQCSGRFGGVGTDVLGQAQELDPKVLMAVATAAMAGATVSCCVGLAIGLFNIWLAAGTIRVQREVLEGGEGQFPTLFSGGNILVKFVLATLLVGLINGGTFLLAGSPSIPFFYQSVVTLMAGDLMSFYTWVLGGLLVLGVITIPIATYVYAGVCFTRQAVVIDDLSPMDALERSWELSKGRKAAIVNYAFVASCFAFVGIFACFVGSIYTGAVAQASFTDAYLRLTGRLRQESEGIAPG